VTQQDITLRGLCSRCNHSSPVFQPSTATK
jgi:hypothetical protein